MFHLRPFVLVLVTGAGVALAPQIWLTVRDHLRYGDPLLLGSPLDLLIGAILLVVFVSVPFVELAVLWGLRLMRRATAAATLALLAPGVLASEIFVYTSGGPLGFLAIPFGFGSGVALVFACELLFNELRERRRGRARAVA